MREAVLVEEQVVVAQHLAQAGTSEKNLLHFSGHATVNMLRRYLGWGLLSRAVAATTGPIALALSGEAQ